MSDISIRQLDVTSFSRASIFVLLLNASDIFFETVAKYLIGQVVARAEADNESQLNERLDPFHINTELLVQRSKFLCEYCIGAN